MKIFINYRRAETEDVAGRLYDRLRREFGGDSIFMDVDNIHSGEIWKSRVERSLSECDIVLALIGQRWETCVDDGGRVRLENEGDPVRYELEFARDNNKAIFPVLVKRADVPKAEALPAGLHWILDRHFTDVRGGTHFGNDVAQLISELRRRRHNSERTEGPSLDFGIVDEIDRTFIVLNWMLFGGFGGAAAVLGWKSLAPSEWTYPWLLLAVVLTVIGLFPAVLIAGGRSLAEPAFLISAVGCVVTLMAKLFDIPEAGGLAILVAYVGLAGASLIAQSLAQEFWRGILAFISTMGALATFGFLAVFVLVAFKGDGKDLKFEDAFVPYLFTALMAVIIGTRGYRGFVLKCCVSLSLWFVGLTMFPGATGIGKLVLFVLLMQAVEPLSTRRWRADLIFWGVGVAALAFELSRLGYLGTAAAAATIWLIGWPILCCSVVVVLVEIADVPREYRRIFDRLRRNAGRHLERIHGWLLAARPP